MIEPGIHSFYKGDAAERGQCIYACLRERGESIARPLKIFSLPNELPAARLGLSVSRRVGSAPRRNQIKRLLRETFRQLDPAVRGRYDFVVVVRPHAPLALEEYQTIVTSLIVKLSEAYSKRRV